MKISELIDLLHSEMLVNGDIEVFVINPYGWEVEPIIETDNETSDPEDITKKLVIYNDG